MAQRPPTTLLMILDGWGIRSETFGNAVAMARTPCLDRLRQHYPHTRLDCSGESVGLPPGIMGNSEVGHLNIGAGRIVYQDLLRIDRSIQDGTFFDSDILNRTMEQVKADRATLHLMGLASDGGVHSQLSHLFALLDMARAKGLDSVSVHAILDGRDTPPDSGAGYVRALQQHLASFAGARIASVCGRFYAMDRDRRWDRIQAAYRLYTQGQGDVAADPEAAVKEAYAKGETDEFVKPVRIETVGSNRPGIVQDGDSVVFFNFRADRAREITRAFTDPGFDGFVRPTTPALGAYVCMTLYDEAFDLPVVFSPVRLENNLGQVISRRGLRQLRIAETEKYAHVTYFFNGGEEQPFVGEDRFLVPSPRDVETYDLKPEMSAAGVTDALMERALDGRYDFVVVNFANMDMVGHTGVLDAAVTAVETVDRCVGRITDAMLKKKGNVTLITADHGNAERMLDDNGRPYTAHTTSQVPLILVDDTRIGARLTGGLLGDIAPTILDIMNIEAPVEMTGRSLLLAERS